VLRAFRGEPREGEETRHLNGDPSDNRLDNLAWGTKKENSADQIRHGTTNRGERHVASKLTHADVVKIRERYAKGDISQRQLAEEYGVQQTVVGGIVRGEDWSHTLGPIKGVDYEIDRVLRGESHGMAKLSKDDVINIRKQYASGSVTQIELAENYKTKQAYISRVVLGKTWKHVGGPIKGEDY
jgi:Trp operon repressor